VAISISVQPLRATEKMQIKHPGADSKVSTWEFNIVESPSELTRRRKVAHVIAGVAARYPSLEHLPLLLLSTNHRPWLEIDTRL
jgi:hypothetical protein